MSQSKKFSIAFFASGRGSNYQAVLNKIEDGSIPGEVCFLLSNNSNSQALIKTQEKGIRAYHVSSKTEGSEGGVEQKMNALLSQHNPDLLVLAGYMKKVPETVIKTMKGKVVNIHPALLPAFGGQGWYGMNVHRGVVEKGCMYTGMTIHLVNEEYDQGAILFQKSVEVLPSDSAEDVADKVIEQEHNYLWKVIKAFAEGILFFNENGLQGLKDFRNKMRPSEEFLDTRR